MLTGIVALILIHFVADFVLQTQVMAQNKSSSNKWLLYHVIIYILPFSLMNLIFDNIAVTLIFMVANMSLHFVTDYVSSRVAKQYWEKKDVHNFFVVIGADQMIHMLTLVLTFAWLYGTWQL